MEYLRGLAAHSRTWPRPAACAAGWAALLLLVGASVWLLRKLRRRGTPAPGAAAALSPAKQPGRKKAGGSKGSPTPGAKARGGRQRQQAGRPDEDEGHGEGPGAGPVEPGGPLPCEASCQGGDEAAAAGPSGKDKKKEEASARRAKLLDFLARLLPRLLIHAWVMRSILNMAVPGYLSSTQPVISFQEFRREWLAERRVSQLNVVNQAWAHVYSKVWPDLALSGVPPGGEGPSPRPKDTFMCKFALGSLYAFEERLDAAQRELGIAPEDMVPIRFMQDDSTTYTFTAITVTCLTMYLLYGLYRTFKLVTMFWSGKDLSNFDSFGKPSSRGMKRGGLLDSLSSMMGLATPHQLDKSAENRTLFKDVAGCDEAKAEIMEFVDFLKHPRKYKEMGAVIPKGALLVGPPGTGKTLLAKAAAGEASVPFLSMNGSEFCEMFAGVGSSKVRDLFHQARAQAPCMIFIDEIDAIGRARGRRAMGADADRESTLNQLLVEMDGFANSDNVVVLGSTNRVDILDKALLRPGRFSRTISIDAPDVKGREAIFRVYLAKLKLLHDLDYYSGRLAALTPGMCGADICNVCNEAALTAARLNKERVDMAHFEGAVDRVIGGLEKKHKVISAEERRVVAVHESGHAVVSWFLEHAQPLLKVSIVPRGSSALGFAQYLPNENLLQNKEQLMDNMCMALGGRAAEQVIIGKISTGAVNDLERVTQMAYAQVAVYGMNERVGLLSYSQDKDAFDRPTWSNETAHLVDTEARLLVAGAYETTVKLVQEKRELIEQMAAVLLEKEVIGLDDVEAILGLRPFAVVNGEMRNIDRFRGKDVAAAGATAGAKAGKGRGGGTQASTPGAKTPRTRAGKSRKAAADGT